MTPHVVSEEPLSHGDKRAGVVLLDLQWLQRVDLERPASAREAWGMLHAAAGLQGLVNRRGPRLFIRFLPEVDDFWWDWFHEPDGWLHSSEAVKLTRVEDAVEHFRDELGGVVTYRARPYAASNVASTIAGVEERLPVFLSGDAGDLAERLEARLPVLFEDRIDLVDEGGRPIWERAEERGGYEATTSTKNNAYRWLAARYMATGRMSVSKLGYYIDSYWLERPGIQPLQNCTLVNHDYFIGHRAMILDLNAWGDESSVDEPDQPAGLDLMTLKGLLRGLHGARGREMLQVGGFTPWAWKYSSEPGAGSAHHGVQSEWELIKILSSYNAYLDADAISLAGMSNASFYQHFPLRDHYPQVEVNGVVADESGVVEDAGGGVAERAYVLFYMGDYDASAWLNQELPRLFRDPARGSVDLCWAFNPNLDQRAPHAMHYARVMATSRDYFVAGDSGAGYVSPAMLEGALRESGIGDGYDVWCEHCRRFYERYDLSITGFIIEGRAPGIGERGLAAYARFSRGGVIAHRHLPEHGVHEGQMPYARMTADLDGPPAVAAESVMSHLAEGGTQFLVFRSVLKSPGWLAELIEHLKRGDAADRLRFVSPKAFMSLIRRHHANQGVDRPAVKIQGDVTRALLAANHLKPESRS
ncbi:hypothetical protein [Mucisphaera sp.]|uniref:hypothetical protein n=1 Tax=Mucisphaera sp. TaxID=2913024 RepID=UPI003D121FDC